MSRILVIDDSVLVSTMLQATLMAEGYEVSVAHDANQGYATAIEFQPDLILLDVQLPDVIGFDLIRIMKNRDDLRHVPIMMVTGTAHTTEDKVKGFQLGADDYVLKPFEVPELLERIKALLKRSAAVPKEPEHPAPVPAPILPAEEKVLQKPHIRSMARIALTLLCSPMQVQRPEPFPPVSMLYLAIALALGYLGLAFAAGPSVKPALMTIAMVGSWTVLVSTLVMSTSVLGIHIGWKDGSRLLSLAAIPILLKLAGAVLVAAWTTLSPFYFLAGPALFVAQPAFWLQRLDVFELWSIFLVWRLVSLLPGGERRKAIGVAACLAAVGLLLTWAVSHFGGAG